MTKSCSTCAFRAGGMWDKFCSHPDLLRHDRIYGDTYMPLRAASMDHRCGPDAKLYRKASFLRRLFP